MIGAAPVWWVISIGAGVGLIAVSLLAFRGDPRRPLTAPTHPGIGLTEGVVVDYWSGAMPRAAAPGLTVVRFADEFGRARFARHLIRRNPTTFGTMGQVQYDRRRPDRVLRFINGRPPFAEYPPHPASASISERQLAAAAYFTEIGLSFLRTNARRGTQKDFPESFSVMRITFAFR